MKVVTPQGRRVIVPPPSHEKLSALAVRSLRTVEAYGVLPTPVDALFEAGDISLVSDAAYTDRAREYL